MSTLLLASDQALSFEFYADRRPREFSTRVLNALRVSAIPFAVGAIGVFVPILHFVIVPAALIVVLVFSVRELTTRYSFGIADLKCLHCGSHYGESDATRLPKRMACFKCGIAATLSETTVG